MSSENNVQLNYIIVLKSTCSSTVHACKRICIGFPYHHVDHLGMKVQRTNCHCFLSFHFVLGKCQSDLAKRANLLSTGKSCLLVADRGYQPKYKVSCLVQYLYISCDWCSGSCPMTVFCQSFLPRFCLDRSIHVHVHVCTYSCL